MKQRIDRYLLSPLALAASSLSAAAQLPPPAYNRSVEEISLQPSAGGVDSFFDIIVEAGFARDPSIPTSLDLSVEALVLVNGVARGSAFTAVAFDPPTNPCELSGCIAELACGTPRFDGIPVIAQCGMDIHPGDDAPYCSCKAVLDLTILMVPAEPGDEIVVILIPAPGGLPELPGFEDDDTGSTRVTVEGTRSFCSGDGTGTPCPCANFGAAGEGCRNSTGAGGELFASGSVDVAADDLVFHGAQLPANQPALLYYGMAWINGGDGTPFGDGLRCVGSQVVRIGVKTADAAGDAQWGPGLAAQHGWVANDHFAFQVWYRDPVGPCGTGFNLTNALDVPLE